MREVIFKVSGEPDETHGINLIINTDASAPDIMIALAATIREVWREIAADDPECGDLFRSSLLSGLNNPDFWTREEASSHD